MENTIEPINKNLQQVEEDREAEVKSGGSEEDKEGNKKIEKNSTFNILSDSQKHVLKGFIGMMIVIAMSTAFVLMLNILRG